MQTKAQLIDELQQLAKKAQRCDLNREDCYAVALHLSTYVGLLLFANERPKQAQPPPVDPAHAGNGMAIASSTPRADVTRQRPRCYGLGGRCTRPHNHRGGCHSTTFADEPLGPAMLNDLQDDEGEDAEIIGAAQSLGIVRRR